jgi:hypothetical protein
MPIDFQLPPDVEEVRLRVRSFMDTAVRPVIAAYQETGKTAIATGDLLT